MAEVETAKYSQTLNLPKTDFPMRGDLPVKEPARIEFWEKLGVYLKLQERDDQNKFVLHDGPPYANGHIHIGHALNKILKDMVLKSRALVGKKVPYRPGWDCHGLPIESALLKEKKMSQRGIKDVCGFRKDAADFAERFIELQKADFKRLGVLADWPNPYKTMDKEYEAEVVGAFRKLLKKGLIYRGLKPVYWCISCETALAEAEIEYKDKTSPSVCVAMPVAKPFPKGLEMLEGVELLIWTTTPWTLPANKAVAINPDFKYQVVRVKINNKERNNNNKERKLLIAVARKDDTLKKIGAEELELSNKITMGSDLISEFEENRIHYSLLYGEGLGIVIGADYVTAEDGTGLVHTAPGHGADDFVTGQKYGLGTFCPVDASGRFTDEVPEFLRGQKVFPQGNESVINDLRNRELLLLEENISHSYPHCWRCKNPVIFRATNQWFMTMDRSNLRGQLLRKIEDSVRWIPEAGKSRIAAMVQNRPDWCLSRQRLWGTPIPILYCADCKKPLTDDATLKAIEKEIRQNGDDFWFKDWDLAVDRVLWPFLPENLKCGCGSEKFHREKDILDVWMDSGMSWAAVLQEEEKKEVRADLYLEGSDQHRGWFQSSLVLSVGLESRAPYKSVLTHGFVLDEKGRAMHKSAGNVVSPQDIIKKYGADILRLWVSLSDYSDDVRISDKILEVPIEGYRKIRNTLRYLLGNTFDFNPQTMSVPHQRLPPLEIYMLNRLETLKNEVLRDYQNFHFRTAAQKIINFCSFDLSAFYCDIVKDRLYTLSPNHPDRRAAQTVLSRCLINLCALAAPILPFTMEEAWQEKPKIWEECESVLLYVLDPLPNLLEGAGGSFIEEARELREKVQKKLEEARMAKLIGSSLEAKVFLKGKFPNSADERLQNFNWAEFFIVSQFESASGESEVEIVVSRADGKKCARCWRYQTDVGLSSKHPELCGRCAQTLG